MKSVDDYYREKCAEESNINQHLPTLKRYASQCGHVTEFGVHEIVSTWALLAARPKKLFSYDLRLPAPRPLQEITLLAKVSGTSFSFVQANVLDVEIEPTELLFIDTWHSYEQLRAELARHASKVARFILLHDTVTFGEFDEDGAGKGLNLAIKEFLEATPEWVEAERFVNNNGLTILARR